MANMRALVVVLSLVSVLTPLHAENTHKGKTAKHWVDRLIDSGDEEALEAILSIGAPCVPLLIHWAAENKDSAWTTFPALHKLSLRHAPAFMNELSRPMQALIDYMRAHQNKIYRHRGGNWGCRICFKPGMKSFATTKVTALIRDKIAEVTDWHRAPEGHNYPAEVMLIDE